MQCNVMGFLTLQVPKTDQSGWLPSSNPGHQVEFSPYLLSFGGFIPGWPQLHPWGVSEVNLFVSTATLFQATLTPPPPIQRRPKRPSPHHLIELLASSRACPHGLLCMRSRLKFKAGLAHSGEGVAAWAFLPNIKQGVGEQTLLYIFHFFVSLFVLWIFNFCWQVFCA